MRGYLSCTKTDQGVGIPETELSNIFDKFTQSSKTNNGAGGTGLGLAICKEIINVHKGKIWAENNPESGATFNFLLPFEQELFISGEKMNTIEILSKQHKEILHIINIINTNIKTDINAKKANEIFSYIKKLSDILEEHMNFEDRYLYPMLKAKPQESIRDLANLFIIELGGINNAFVKYLNRWDSLDKVLKIPEEFISETKAIIISLRNRIQKEDNELFPMVHP